jgi:4-hydroxy-tetrahydrodipicolinate synthase
MFRGTYTALVTPFRNGSFDTEAFEKLVEAQIAGGVTGIVPVGTTGESPTLDHAEHMEVVKLAVKFAAGRCQVIAGTGSNSTEEAVSLTKEAAKAGADGALLVAPYYNKPTQEGLYQHYKAIASASPLPLILYSIPGRCGIEIGIETVVRLANDCPTIVSIKEAGGSVERVSQLKLAVPDAFTILSGDDSLTLPFLSVGAVGVISVASNIVPKDVADLVKAWESGDAATALKHHLRLYPLFKDLFIESNPAPVKAAMSWMGMIQPDVRLPLVQISEASAARLRGTLAKLQLL